jgi:hypothetical protein
VAVPTNVRQLDCSVVACRQTDCRRISLILGHATGVTVIVLCSTAACRQKCRQLIKPSNVAAVNNTHVNGVAVTGCHSALHNSGIVKITLVEKAESDFLDLTQPPILSDTF